MTKMTEQDFQVCLNAWTESKGGKPFWGNLAVQLGYEDGEILRSTFKRERKRRSLVKVSNQLVLRKPELPVVGVFDIEMLPAEAFFFQPDAYISAEKVTKKPALLSYAFKYLNGATIFSDVLTPDEAVSRDDSRLAKGLNDLLQSCTMLVGHNIKSYDYPHVKTLSVRYGLYPLKHSRLIDTLSIARSEFNFMYNSMAELNKELGIRNKVSHEGFSLWRRCSYGDPHALATMLEYNQGDILANEELFWKFQPYVNLPNLSVYNDEANRNICWCGCENFVKSGYWTTETSRFERLSCSNCGSFVRGKKSILSKEKKDTLLVSI